ncbi:MAG: OmpA family protein [Variovorax sp.]|nr:MAG: OmpA family protein [Variovorax sp.]
MPIGSVTTKLLRNTALAAPAFAIGIALAAEPAKDHPLVGRYEGSVMEVYKPAAYDEVGLFKEPFQNWGGGRPDLLQLEGKVSAYYYRLPAGRSLLEVQRNYEASLKAKGFTLLFICATANSSCYKPRPDRPPTTDAYDLARALDVPDWPRLGGNSLLPMAYYFEVSGRYLLAKQPNAKGTTYASILLGEGKPAHGNYAYVRVVESQAMEGDKIVFVDATAMQKGLAESGRINLYGIHFDLDKDVVEPESQPTLNEMTKLMRASPQLRLQVVGHTDSQGDGAHNKSLSHRRSVAVIAALVKAGVDPRRLTTRGAGAAEPIAPNDNEAGRAKNRRVELIRL